MKKELILGKIGTLSLTNPLILTGLVLLAGGIIYLIGFAPYPAVHDSFHDVRHSMGFPCH